MIKAAVGDVTDFTPQYTKIPVATKLLALTPGVVEGLPSFNKISEQYNVVIEQHLNIGDTINEYHTNLDGCGYVIATDSDVYAAIDKASKVKKIIDNSIIRR